MTVGPSTLTPDQQSARAILNDALSQYGLEALGTQVWNWFLSGMPIQQIMLEIRDTDAYRVRFPYMETLRQAGHAISEATAIELERSYTQIAREHGLPAGFYDQPDDFAALIGGEVSPQEFNERLQDYQAFVYDTDPTARQQLQSMYGIGESDIAAYLIDPQRALPLLQRQAGAALVSAAGVRSGYGALTQAEGELLSGVSPEDAAQGFGTLVDLREVLGQLPGEADVGVGREEAQAAVFRSDANARRRIAQRAARRKAEFEAGGGFTSSDQGYSGVG